MCVSACELHHLGKDVNPALKALSPPPLFIYGTALNTITDNFVNQKGPFRLKVKHLKSERNRVDFDW